MGQTALIKIDRMVLGGDGLGHAQSNGSPSEKVCFVPFGLPGEEILSTETLIKKNYSKWIPLQIKKPSGDRMDPRCSVHFRPGSGGRWCGGCQWQHMTHRAQLQHKGEMLKDTLMRLGGIQPQNWHPPLESPDLWRYRNKVQIPFGMLGGKMVAGFYSPGSHEIVEFDDCPVQPELSVRIFQVIRQIFKAGRYRAYDEDSGTGWLRHVLIRTNRNEDVMVVLVTKTGSFDNKPNFLKTLRKNCPEVVGVFQNIQPAKTHVVLGPKWVKLWGQDYLQEKVGPLNIRYHPGSFMQVNTAVAERLFELAIQGLQLGADWTVLDFYCGVGITSLLLAKKVRWVIGVEEGVDAIRWAKLNAKNNRVSNVRFLAQRAETFSTSREFKMIEEMASNRLAVLLDPPRSGCDERVLKGVIRLKPKRMAYISCDPATLARDLKILALQYDLKSVTLVDMFPQTSHIESLSILERKT